MNIEEIKNKVNQLQNDFIEYHPDKLGEVKKLQDTCLQSINREDFEDILEYDLEVFKLFVERASKYLKILNLPKD